MAYNSLPSLSTKICSKSEKSALKGSKGGPKAFSGLAPDKAPEALLAVQEASRSVWNLSVPGSSGSGFFLSPRLLAANLHVIENFLESAKLSDIVLSQNGVPGGIKIRRLISASAIKDIAFLETAGPAPSYLKLREEALSKDEAMFALGCPKGTGYPKGVFRALENKGPLKSFGGRRRKAALSLKKSAGTDRRARAAAPAKSGQRAERGRLPPAPKTPDKFYYVAQRKQLDRQPPPPVKDSLKRRPKA